MSAPTAPTAPTVPSATPTVTPVRARFARARRATCALAGVLAFAAAPALAADLLPGGSLDPLPVESAPAGTLELSGSLPFSLTFTRTFPTPFTHTASGNVAYSVYRHPDNTLSFRYDVNHTGGNTIINHFTARDFAGFSTNTAVLFSFLPSGDAPDSALRSFDGNSLQYFWDLGLSGSGRTFFVKTDATSFDTRGTATLYMFPTEGGGSFRGLPRPVVDNTPPVVAITAPTSLGPTCNPATIVGTASDTGGLESFTVAYSANVNGPWTQIATSTTPVNAGTLAVWNTAAIPQGWYYLRLTAENTSGLSSVVTSVVFVDKQFDTIDLRSPAVDQILGGSVCFDGTVNDSTGGSLAQYLIQYAPFPANAPFNAVDPASSPYTTAIVNDGLGSWNTRTGPAAVADGPYTVRILATDICGNSRTVTRRVVIDNTRPVAEIAQPARCRNVSGIVPVIGTVADANLSGWTLQYTGGSASSWVTIASGSGPVNNALLGNWNTTGLAPCAYTLRLIASDAAAVNCGSTTNQTEFTVSVNVGCPADFNRSGAATVQDVFDFLAAYFNGCP